MYSSETQKIRPKVLHYVNGKVADIGCGGDKIVPSAIGIDVRQLPTVDLLVDKIDKLSDKLPHDFDVIFSSHCLEHIDKDIETLRDWVTLLKSGGLVILYLPDVNYYTQHNPDHVHNYTFASFNYKIAELTNLTVVESGMDIGDDKYSFYFVAKKS